MNQENNRAQRINESVEDKTLYGCFNDVKNVIAVMSGKGGVGKSTISALLAVALRQKGMNVGLLDADITGPSLPKAFGIRDYKPFPSPYGIMPALTKSGIKLVSVNLFLASEDDPVIWRGPLLAGAVKQFWEETDWRDLDYMIVDLPPGTGDVPLTVLQTLPVSGIVVVASPQELATMVVKKSIKMARAVGSPILGLIENMSALVCPHCGEMIDLFGTAGGEKLAADTGVPWLGSVAWDTSLNTSMDAGEIERADTKTMMSIAERLLADKTS